MVLVVNDRESPDVNVNVIQSVEKERDRHMFCLNLVIKMSVGSLCRAYVY